MNPVEAARWQVTTTLMQINALINWATVNRENLPLPTILFICYTIQKLHLYILTTNDIISAPTVYQLCPRLIF
jgi:hypothetical protein